MRKGLTSVFAAGAVAGALDITYAYVFWALKADVPALRIFQSVATGLLGRASFDGGAATAALGLALHFAMATAMAAAYALAARQWRVLREWPLPLGAAYGVFLYAVMQYVVLPLSAAGHGSHDATWITLSVLAHMFLVGIPIAFLTRNAFAAK
jgi:hypothetical protein